MIHNKGFEFNGYMFLEFYSKMIKDWQKTRYSRLICAGKDIRFGKQKNELVLSSRKMKYCHILRAIVFVTLFEKEAMSCQKP